MFSNKYIFIYTGVLVIVVAVVLALAATLLQPMQQRNRDAAKMQEILKAAGINAEREEAVEIYPQVITGEMLVDREGNVTDQAAGCAFKANMKAELAKGEDARFPVFTTRDSLYIMPMYGNGLWGPIWGYIALQSDFNTVSGVSFGHQGETPGLGAEIVSDKFQGGFKGKKIFNTEGRFVSITAQKGGADKYPGPIDHAVDAVSGGTITSKGVTAMLHDCLKCYEPFLLKGVVAEDMTVVDTVVEEEIPEPEPEPEPVPVVRKPVRKAAPVVTEEPKTEEPAAVAEPASEPEPMPVPEVQTQETNREE